MIKQEYLDLIHQEVDNQNSPQERKLLQDFLHENEEGRNLLTELREIAAIMHESRSVEVPQNLKKNIMNSLRERRRAIPIRRGFRDLVANYFEMLTPRKPALVFAGGLSLGVIAMLLLHPAIRVQPVETVDISGAIALNLNTSSFEQVGHIPIHADRVSGDVKVLRGERMLLLDVTLSSGEDIQAQFNFNPEATKFGGVRPTGDAQNFYRLGADFFTLTHSGFHHYLLAFKNTSDVTSTIRFQLFSNGSPVFVQEINGAR